MRERIANLGDIIVRYRHRALINGMVFSPDNSDRVWSWVRSVLPVSTRQRAVLTFAGWHGSLRPSQFSVEVSTDTRGLPTIANEQAVVQALNAIDSGRTVMVQVQSTSTQQPYAPSDPSTVRAWWFGDSPRPRSISADELRQRLATSGPVAAVTNATRFETGWSITGEPGGALPPHIANGRLGHHGRHCRV